MSKSDIISIYDKSPKIAVLESTFAARQKSQMTGLVGSSLSFVANSLFKKSELPFLILFSNKEEAAYYLNDLEQLINTEDVLFYPSCTEDLIKLKRPITLMFYYVLRF